MRVDRTSLDQTIPAIFAEQVRRHAARPAIVTAQGRVTYAALDHASDRIARALIEQGHRHGRTVGILIEQGIDQIAAILAALKAGGVYVPLDASLGRARLREMLADADPDCILTDALNRSLSRLLGGPNRRVIDVQGDLPAGGEVRASQAGSPDDYAYIYYTSGTTGSAKGVVDSHRNVLHNVARYTAALDVDCNDRLTLLQSCGFSGAVSNIFTALLNGATLLPFDVRSKGATALAAWLAEQRPTIYHSVPSLFRQVASSGIALPSLRIVRLEGDLARPIDVETFNRHFDARCTLVNGLGATETGISAQHFIAHGAQVQGSAVPVGRATADVRIEIVDSEGQPVAPGTLGEIVICSEYLACGYWRRPELTDSAFFTGPDGRRRYRTRDLGRLDSDGLLELHGRADLRTKVRGEWVDLSVVERALAACPGVRDAIVETRSDPTGNPILVAWVQSQARAQVTAAQLRDALAAQNMPAHAWPARFVAVDRWPLDRNGKVDRRALVPESGLTAPARPPRGRTEQLVAEVFERRLGMSAVSAADDFFELGGDSLQAMEACLDLERLTGTPLALGLFQHAPSVAALARALENSIEPECIVPLQPHGSGPALLCVHAHMGHVFNLRELAAQFAPERPFFAIQARGLDGRSPLEIDLEAMADDYVAQVVARQPRGPYLIAGYCFGAWVAIEMARRLQQRGAHVGALLLIDPDLPRGMEPERRGSPGNVLRSAAGRFRRETRARLLQWAVRSMPENSALRRRLLRSGEGVSTVMAGSYQPRPYEGRAVVLTAADKPLQHQDRQAWARYVIGDVQFRRLAGPTSALLRHPYVRDLAACLLLELEAAGQPA